MKIDLIVFDIAGTTLNDKGFIVAESFTNALKKNGFDFTKEEINSVMGYRKIEAITMMLNSHNVDASPTLIEIIHNDFLENINCYYEENNIQEVDGASVTFRHLKNKGVKIALDTGFSRSTTDIIINKLGWGSENLIDTSVTSDEVPEGRPAPFMIEAIKRELGINSSMTVAKVGDTPSDLMEGNNANCALNIGVLYGTHTRQQLEKHPHTHLIEHISEITDLVEGN